MHSCPVRYTTYPSSITMQGKPFPGYAESANVIIQNTASSCPSLQYRPHNSLGTFHKGTAKLFCSSRRIQKNIDVDVASVYKTPLQKSMPNQSKSNLFQHVSNKESIRPQFQSYWYVIQQFRQI